MDTFWCGESAGYCFFRMRIRRNVPQGASFRSDWVSNGSFCMRRQASLYRCESLGDVILMGDRTSNDESRGLSVRDRRFCIRYPFAADVVILDLETGTKSEGVTSDL